MPMRADDPADELEEHGQFAGGTTWLAHPEEAMARASHILDTDAGILLVDPVDAPGLDELVSEFGDVAGVVLLLDRHERDCTAVATRHDVPVYRPSFLTRDVGVQTDPFSGTLPGTDYSLIRVLDTPVWNEAALFDGETLVVPEAVGTAEFFRGTDERLGVHPALRLTPPSALRGLRPERVLVGHGTPVHEAATDSLRYALAHSRRNAPGVFAKGLLSALR
ncbi:hypothetical protein GCM10009037_01630 [Halarchaeum grantii]|uniref:Metallo-beta-lactamase superfamily protein n=2 Tax=Halarchaeum grantii TaxID=1193105 RepID=A0A830F556_9EURY|nr:hypothetical protein [Halarchaeum grantii]GGL21941.1 hypothetical protein GCM10009037_01630 [Halarchaeum grantii]